MKHLQNFLIRSICGAGVGVLLILHRDSAITWFTIACGALFFISGLISCAFYLGQRSHKSQQQMYDIEGKPLKERAPAFPLVGVGSIVLGAILVFMRGSFVQWIPYVLAGILILGAINQYMSLARARKYCHVGMLYWVISTLVLLVGLLIVCNPKLLGELILKVIGWTFLVYAATELIIGINTFRAHRRMEKELKARQEALEAEQAQIEDAQAEEITEEAEKTDDESIEDAEVVTDEKPEEEEEVADEHRNTINFDRPEEDFTVDAF